MSWMKCSTALEVLTVSVCIIVLCSNDAKADFTFGEPTNLGPTVNSSVEDERPSISADGLSLYFNSILPGGYGSFDIWMTTRATTADEWGEPVNLGPTVNSGHRDQTPCISPDGLSLYFNSGRPGGYGGTLWGDIWVTERAATSDPWGTPVNLGPIVNSPGHAYGPSISADGLSLYFGSDRPGGLGGDDLFVSTRITIDDSWREPVNLGQTVNSSVNEGTPSISADGLALFSSGYAFGPYRSGGSGNADLWVTTRATVSDAWGDPVNLGRTINTTYHDFFPGISADGSTLFFMSDRFGGYGSWDLWQAPVFPIVDFNGDGKVDGFEVCTMAERWGTDDSLCDIGPMPWGDSIVDVEDLKVLAKYIGKERVDKSLMTHWALDETEGSIAYDSAADNDGMLMRGPAWQPDDGMVGGTLGFDGVDDHVITDPVLNPANGPFSVLAWIKGGASGQAIISQQDGVT